MFSEACEESSAPEIVEESQETGGCARSSAMLKGQRQPPGVWESAGQKVRIAGPLRAPQ